jgi:photosystem II stability/assembly factor-like uncharacterized protein
MHAPRRSRTALLALLSGLLAVGWTGTREPAAAQTGPLDRSLLAGLGFRHIGPANMSGRVVDLAVVEDDPYTFYVATATGGLWKTRDNGVTFTAVFEHEAVHSIGCVTVYQGNPDIVWVGTGERANRQSSSWGDGVYRSVDGGRTWANMGLRDSHHVGRIVLHPRNPNIVYVAAMGHLWGPNDERGLFRSTDGGVSWTNVLAVDEDTGVVDVAMDPSNPDVLFAATYQRRRTAYGFDGGGPGSGLHKSIDGGETWTELTEGLPSGDQGRIGISIYRADPRIVYASVEQGVRYNASTAYGERRAGIYRSDDAGESWELMSDWNPRPMYASQILVDPSDDQRIYMVNSYSFSDDGGRTFTRPNQSLHGDDRIVWVDPNDSRHVMKGDDGGLGISYDRGLTWLYITSLPVSQYYRVAVDMRTPYWIYGGLQDNGSWAGPSATYETSGILNEDWLRVGGGDGFGNQIDPTDNRTLYTASQYLGLSRLDLVTRERTDIRPGDPQGHIADRRNWDTWGNPDAREPMLGNAMAPANWDAPFILSPHDPRTIYAGTDELWKSRDQGNTWTSLGNLTTGVDRSTLSIMGQRPSETTLSLDDGIPYYPTLTAIAESPVTPGLLYVGTDDGNVQVSQDDGASWTNVADRFPDLPERSYVSSIEASRHRTGTVYVAFDGHRSDDFDNYLYRSDDVGQSWASIAGSLPDRRVIRAVHEDPRNPDVVYIGTELGFFLSLDRGQSWVELKNNLPRVAVNDLAIHPRDNDLVLGTHGRGIWILDGIASLQELTPAVRSREAHIFTIEPAEMIRYTNTKAHAGDMIFRGDNPPAGAVIDYYLRERQGDDVELTLAIADASGAPIADLVPKRQRGINRVVWNLRYPRLAPPAVEQGEAEQDEPRGPEGPFVLPGTYTVRLGIDGRTVSQTLEVREDPRIIVSEPVRQAWTDTLLDIGRLYESVGELVGRVETIEARVAQQPRASSAGTRRLLRRADTLKGTLRELQRRVRTLYTAVSASVGPLTADQQTQLEYVPEAMQELKSQLITLEG